MGFINSSSSANFTQNTQGPSEGYYDENYTSKCIRISSITQGTSAYHVENFQSPTSTLISVHHTRRTVKGRFSTLKRSFRQRDIGFHRIFRQNKASNSDNDGMNSQKVARNNETDSEETRYDQLSITSSENGEQGYSSTVRITGRSTTYLSETSLDGYSNADTDSDTDSIDHAGSFNLSERRRSLSPFKILKTLSMRSRGNSKRFKKEPHSGANDSHVLEYYGIEDTSPREKIEKNINAVRKRHTLRKLLSLFGRSATDERTTGQDEQLEEDQYNSFQESVNNDRGSLHSKKSLFNYLRNKSDSEMVHNEPTLTEKYLGGEDCYKRLADDMDKIPFDLTIDSTTHKSLHKKLSQLFIKSIDHFPVSASEENLATTGGNALSLRGLKSKSLLNLFAGVKKEEEDFAEWNPYEKVKREIEDEELARGKYISGYQIEREMENRRAQVEYYPTDDTSYISTDCPEDSQIECFESKGRALSRSFTNLSFVPKINQSISNLERSKSIASKAQPDNYLDEKISTLSRRSSLSSRVFGRLISNSNNGSITNLNNSYTNENASVESLMLSHNDYMELSRKASKYRSNFDWRNPTTNDFDNEFDKKTLYVCEDSAKTITPGDGSNDESINDSSIMVDENTLGGGTEVMHNTDSLPRCSQRFLNRLYLNVPGGAAKMRLTAAKSRPSSKDNNKFHGKHSRPRTSSFSPLSFRATNSQSRCRSPAEEDTCDRLFFNNPKFRELHSDEFIESSKSLELNIIKLASLHKQYPY